MMAKQETSARATPEDLRFVDASAPAELTLDQQRIAGDEVFFLVSPDGRDIVYVSSAYERIWGRTCQSLYESPRAWVDAVVEQDRPLVLAALERETDGNLPVVFPEYRISRPNGPQRFIQSRSWPVFDDENNIYRVARIAEDITELKRAEDQLRQSREDLARAQEVGQIGSWRLDVRHNVLTWSDESHHIFGIPKGTPLTYESFLGAVHPEDREYVHQQWSAALRGEPYAIEHRIVVDDAVRWVREKAYLEFDGEGELQGGFGITQDITQLKHSEEALRASKDFVDKVLNSSLNGLYIFDVERRMNAFINQSYTALTGYTLEEVNALGEDTFFALFHPDDQSRVAAHMQAVQNASDEDILEIEYRFKTKDGPWKWFFSRDRVFLRAADGTVRQFMGTFLDITERKEAESKLIDSQRLSQALNRINRMIHATLDPGEIMQVLVRQGAEALGCETAAISLRQANRWLVRHVHGFPENLVGSAMDDEEELHALLALQTRGPVTIEDAWADERVNRDHMRRHNIRAVLVVPLVVRNVSHGVIFFNQHATPRTFSQDQILFGRQLAATASIALENVHLFEERRQAEKQLHRLNKTLEFLVAERTAVAERRARDLRRLADELSEAEHRERTRLAKLLHDDLQQLLLAVKLRLPLLAETPQDQLTTHVERLDELVGECLSTSRNLTQELSPPVLQCGTLCEVVEWLGQWFAEKHGLTVAVHLRQDVPPAPEHLRVFLFQAVRELLFNVVKHSGKMQARVDLSFDAGQLTVQVEDDGNDFDPQTVRSRLQEPESFGLFNIRERLEALLGGFEIERTPHGGARFRLVVPMGDEGAPWKS